MQQPAHTAVHAAAAAATASAVRHPCCCCCRRLLCRAGGLSFLVKASSNKWLGNAATFSDFFFKTGQLPPVPSGVVGSPAASTEDSHLQGPALPLDMDRYDTMAFATVLTAV